MAPIPVIMVYCLGSVLFFVKNILIMTGVNADGWLVSTPRLKTNLYLKWIDECDSK